MKGEVVATDVQNARTKVAGKERNRVSTTRGPKVKKEAGTKKSDKVDVKKESKKGNADQECVISISLCSHYVTRVPQAVAAEQHPKPA